MTKVFVSMDSAALSMGADEVAQAIAAHAEADLIDVGGVGGTLAGNALSLAAMRATLGEVLTDAAFAHMIELGTRYTNQVQEILTKYEVDWSIAQIRARAEYRFVSPAPTSGTDYCICRTSTH